MSVHKRVHCPLIQLYFSVRYGSHLANLCHNFFILRWRSVIAGLCLVRPQVFRFGKIFASRQNMKDAVVLFAKLCQTMEITAATVNACQCKGINLKHDQFEQNAGIFRHSRFRYGRTRLLLSFSIPRFLRKLKCSLHRQAQFTSF